MDSLSTTHHQKPKPRKIKRIAKKSRNQIILDLFFRAVEIIVVLVTVAKLCNELIIAFQDSGVTEVILANRSLAFVVGNAIVIALIAKSGVFSNQEADPKSPKCKSNDLYDEFVQESSKRNRVKQSITETTAKQSETEKEKQSITENIAKQSISDKTEKQSITEKKTKQSNSDKTEKHSVTEKKTKQSKTEKVIKQSIVEITVKKKEEEKQSLNEKKQSQSYRRSKSENLEGIEKSSSCESTLRRSETERFDSDDELRYKIESFIARQRRNQNDD